MLNVGLGLALQVRVNQRLVTLLEYSAAHGVDLPSSVSVTCPACLISFCLALQVHVIGMLVALLEYVAARDFDLPAPLIEEGDEPAVPVSAPHQRRTSDLIGALEDDLEPEVRLKRGSHAHVCTNTSATHL